MSSTNETRTGTKTRVINVPIISPPIATTASGASLSSPRAQPRAIGIIPTDVPKAVMRTGRVLILILSKMASFSGFLSFLAFWMKSIRRIELFTITPARRIIPMKEGIHWGLPVIRRDMAAPMIERGIAAMIEIG